MIDNTNELIRLLGEMDARVKHLEKSPNRLFELIECDTLSLFHWFNQCFKQFWYKFDRHSARQLLQYQRIVKEYSELSNSYMSMFGQHIDYLERVLDDEKSVKDLAPFIFIQDNGNDILTYYNERLQYFTDKEGNPLYKIEIDNNSRTKYIDDTGRPKDGYVFHSDVLNYVHYQSLCKMRYCLNSIFHLMDIVCSYPYELNSGYNPSLIEITKAMEKELRQYAKEKGEEMYRNLKQIYFKLYRSNPSSQPTDIWGKVMKLEDDAFSLAISGKLVENNEDYFEHLVEDQRKQWTDNNLLLQIIKDTCIDDELFDVKLAVGTYHLLSAVCADNLDLFYELVLRRNIIHCEMFPKELKAKYEEWVSPSEERPTEENRETLLDEARLAKLNEIIRILQKGNWKNPATTENVTILLNTVFGKDVSLLEESDVPQCEKMWFWAEHGGGDRIKNVVPSNLAGLFRVENLLNGTPNEISKTLFGKIDSKYISNINNGDVNNSSSEAYKAIVPFLKKYISKIIRKK